MSPKKTTGRIPAVSAAALAAAALLTFRISRIYAVKIGAHSFSRPMGR